MMARKDNSWYNTHPLLKRMKQGTGAEENNGAFVLTECQWGH